MELELAFEHSDHLGAPAAVTGAEQGALWSTTRLPFGAGESYGPVDNRAGFPGQWKDSETGLHYNMHRSYAEELGRYVSADPIGLQGGMSPYIYADANPTGLVDPLGLQAWTGEFWMFGAGFGPATGQVWKFELLSECNESTATRIKATIWASELLNPDFSSLSSSLRELTRVKALEVGGKIELEDGMMSPSRSALRGTFFIGHVSAAWGIGASVRRIRIGQAEDNGFSVVAGVGSGYDSFKGIPFVDFEDVACACD